MNAAVSVIIASNNAEAVIVECLTRLLHQGEHSKLEIIVADSSTDTTAQLVRMRFPQVRLLHFTSPTSVPVLRGRGIAVATGQIIAFLDPYSMVGQDWLKQLIRVHTEHDHPVIGGTVDLYQADCQGVLTWAQYFNEYGMFMAPVEEGPTGILPGSNISYKRNVLYAGDSPRFKDFWKTFVNAGIRRSGKQLWQSSSVNIALQKPVGFGGFLLTRFTHGRCYAGMRCVESGLPIRFLRVLSTPLLPFLLQYRWSRQIWRKKRHRRKFLQTLALQFILFSCWSLGEFTGYLTGPGKSCTKLYY